MKSFRFLGVKFDLTSRQNKKQGYVIYYFKPTGKSKIKLANKNYINEEMVISGIHFENSNGKFNWTIEYISTGMFFGYIKKDSVYDYFFNEDIDKVKELG